MTLADAIINSKIILVKELIKFGDDINQIDEYGFTPLIESIIVNNLEITELLLNLNANPNLPDITGRTPLHWATDNNNLIACNLLLLNKADPNCYTISGQPILVNPILRNQNKLISLLIKFGAKISFAKNYINTKLIGHRFELPGQTHILSPNNKLILINYEGFNLEFSLNIILDSLHRFQKNYAAKNLNYYLKKIDIILKALSNAASLTKLQHYTTNLEAHRNTLNSIFSSELLLIPAVYQGHAICFAKYNNLIIKCDRGANSKFEGCIIVYKINKQNNLSFNFYKDLIFKKHDDNYMHKEINFLLDLNKIIEIPIKPQIVGNCTWANAEASVLAIWFLILYFEYTQNSLEKSISDSIFLFTRWREWDKDRALNECIQRFELASELEKASLASILGAILFSEIALKSGYSTTRATLVFNILNKSKYSYILDSIIKIFGFEHPTTNGLAIRELYRLVKNKQI